MPLTVTEGKGKLIDKCDALYVWHKDALFRIAFSAVGGNREWALKLLEECMLEACQNIDRFGDEKSVDSKSKLIALLHNQINKIYSEVWQKMGLDDEPKKISATQKEIYNVDQILIRNEMTAELAKYVERLTNADKKLIFMRYYMGFTDEELAKEYGCNPDDIEHKAFYVKQKMAKMILER